VFDGDADRHWIAEELVTDRVQVVADADHHRRCHHAPESNLEQPCSQMHADRKIRIFNL